MLPSSARPALTPHRGRCAPRIRGPEHMPADRGASAQSARVGISPSRPSRNGGLRTGQADSTVQHRDAFGASHHRVEVGFGQFRQVVGHLRQPGQQLLEPGKKHGPPAPRPNSSGAQRGAVIRSWTSWSVSGARRAAWSASTSVAVPPSPNRTSGPKTSSWTTPANSSVPRAASGCTTTPVIRPANRVSQVPEGGADLGVAPQVEVDGVLLALVQQAGPVGLHDHPAVGAAQPVGGEDGVVLGLGPGPRELGNAVAGRGGRRRCAGRASRRPGGAARKVLDDRVRARGRRRRAGRERCRRDGPARPRGGRRGPAHVRPPGVRRTRGSCRRSAAGSSSTGRACSRRTTATGRARRPGPR